MNTCETTIPAHDRQKIEVGSSPSIISSLLNNSHKLSSLLVSLPLSTSLFLPHSLFNIYFLSRSSTCWRGSICQNNNEALILTGIQDKK